MRTLIEPTGMEVAALRTEVSVLADEMLRYRAYFRATQAGWRAEQLGPDQTGEWIRWLWSHPQHGTFDVLTLPSTRVPYVPAEVVEHLDA